MQQPITRKNHLQWGQVDMHEFYKMSLYKDKSLEIIEILFVCFGVVVSIFYITQTTKEIIEKLKVNRSQNKSEKRISGEAKQISNSKR